MRGKFMTTCLGALVMAVGMSFYGQAEAGATRAKVLTFDDGRKVGHAKLKRKAFGIMFDVHTSELGPNHAYTIWWIIYNHPEVCENKGKCGFDDIGKAGVEATVLYATGRVADDAGNGWFTAFLPKGLVRLNRTVTGRERHRVGPGLQNLHGAQVTLVIRGHGEAQTGGALVEQLATFDGGCTTEAPCVDVQYVDFPVHHDDHDDHEHHDDDHHD